MENGIYHVTVPCDTLDLEKEDSVYELQEILMNDKRFDFFIIGETVIFLDKNKLSLIPQLMANEYDNINHDNKLFNVNSPYYEESKRYIISKILPDVDIWKSL